MSFSFEKVDPQATGKPCVRLLNEVRDRDYPNLTREQDQQVTKACQRIMTGNIKFDDIVELEGFPGFFRWKPSADIRHQCDCEIRMVYRNFEGSIQIIAVRTRNDVYRVATNRIKSQLQYR